MEANKLTGIERELVLQYLIDGNVPVTVTPVEEESADDDEVKPATSAVFPIAIKAEQLKVLEQGIILLTNSPENVKNYIDKKVRVEFYFNRLGLYFETRLKEIKAGLALVIPSSISRIAEPAAVARPTEFSAEIYYSMSRNAREPSKESDSLGDIHINCVPAQGYDIFSKPVWKDIAEDAQQKAKSYLEEFIVHARKQGVAGSGVQLIPVVRFLAEKVVKIESIEGRKDPLEVLFINHERIVFGAKTKSIDLKEANEYALEMTFPMQRPLNSRKIFTTCRVETNYTNDEKNLTCAVCRYTSIQEEDLRFLYEKCTNEKFV